MPFYQIYLSLKTAKPHTVIETNGAAMRVCPHTGVEPRVTCSKERPEWMLISLYGMFLISSAIMILKVVKRSAFLCEQ